MSITKKSDSLSHASYDSYKPMPEVREGDWVCVRCSNFNFSFRNTCNRCRIQTRDTNFFEFVYAMPIIVAPETDMNTEEVKKEQIEKIFESNKENNPFKSAVLLTPIKNQKPQSDGEPYKSPSCLPSVSPLLKKYNNCLRNQNFSNTTKITTSPYQIRQFKDISISEFNIDTTTKTLCYDEDELDIQFHISKLLASIDL